MEEANLMNTEVPRSRYDGLDLSKADLRNAQVNIDIRTVDMSGVKILEWQQEGLLESIGIIVYP